MTNDNQHIPAGYKPSPLGPIPEDWEVKRLGEVCDFLRTNTLSRNQLNDTNGDIQNIHYGDVLVKYPSIIDAQKESIPFINKEEYKESMNDFIEDGDIIMADTAEDETVGKACEITNVNSKKILAGLHTMLIRPQKGLFSSLFLGYQVNSTSYHKQLNALIQGIKVCSVGKQAIANTYLSLTPLEEQQRIVSVLSLWDTAIKKQTALIEQLTLRKRGLMQQLLTGKKRLKGFEGEWEKIKFKEIFQRKTQIVNDSSNVQVLSVTKEGIVSQKEYFNKEVASDDTSKYLLVEKGDLAMSGLNFWMGSCHILTQYEKGIISPAYKVFSIRDGFSIEYIVNFVQSYNFKSSLLGSSVIGASIVRRNLDLEMLEEWTYLLPSLPEQKAISAILERADKEIEIQKQKLAAMQAQKKGLMQVLLSGKKRLLFKEE